ncbi:hypothetical protein PT2222_190156 [Paraburkholderia tropica]
MAGNFGCGRARSGARSKRDADSMRTRCTHAMQTSARTANLASARVRCDAFYRRSTDRAACGRAPGKRRRGAACAVRHNPGLSGARRRRKIFMRAAHAA